MKRKIYNDDDKEEDRISDLPDCVLLRILSFLKAKQAVQTCILSTRWKYLWKHLSKLLILPSDFKTPDGSTEFATQLFSLRDDSTALYSLAFGIIRVVPPELLENILQYAVSHNVRRLQISLLYNIEHIPSCIFSCHTVTCLDITVHCNNMTLFPNSLNLPALTKLYLEHFVFRTENDGRAEPFSALKKLNRLMIMFCKVLDSQNLCISNTTLANLKIQTDRKWNYREIELSTPRLSKFAYAGIPFSKLCGSHLCSVKHVYIDAYMRSKNAKPPSNLLSWLKIFTKIKSLTVTSTTLEVLSLYPNLLKVKLHCLHNLTSLRVKKEGISWGSSKTVAVGKFWKLTVRCREEVDKFRETIFKEGTPDIPDGIVGFLLQNSPSAKVHIIDQIQNVKC